MGSTSQDNAKVLLYMTSAVLAAALVLPLRIEAQCGGGGGAVVTQLRVREFYDKAGDATIISLAPVGQEQALMIGALYECPGSGSCAPGAVQMVLIAVNPRAEYENANTLTITVPGAAPLSFTPQYSVSRKSGAVRETLAWIMSTEEFLTTASAQRIDVQLGAARSQLSTDQRSGLAMLASRIAAGQRE